VKAYFDHYYDELYTFLAERKARYVQDSFSVGSNITRTEMTRRKLLTRPLTEEEKRVKMQAFCQIESEYIFRWLRNNHIHTLDLVTYAGAAPKD
jgi:hypothetical protein